MPPGTGPFVWVFHSLTTAILERHNFLLWGYEYYEGSWERAIAMSFLVFSLEQMQLFVGFPGEPGYPSVRRKLLRADRRSETLQLLCALRPDQT